MRVRCRCGTSMPPEDVDVARRTATCSACGATQVLSGQLAWSASRRPAAGPELVAHVSGTTLAPTYREPIVATGDRWTFRWLRASWAHAVMLCVALTWDATMLVAAIDDVARHSFVVLLLPHLWAGLAATYYFAAHLVNRATVTLDEGTLSVTHGPWPWPARRLARTDVVTVEAATPWWRWGQPPSAVRARDRHGRSVRLVGDLPERIASELARRLRDALARA